jgi:hypothetical protein
VTIAGPAGPRHDPACDEPAATTTTTTATALLAQLLELAGEPPLDDGGPQVAIGGADPVLPSVFPIGEAGAARPRAAGRPAGSGPIASPPRRRRRPPRSTAAGRPGPARSGRPAARRRR